MVARNIMVSPFPRAGQGLNITVQLAESSAGCEPLQHLSLRHIMVAFNHSPT
jgi:hypothetical protein